MKEQGDRENKWEEELRQRKGGHSFDKIKVTDVPSVVLSTQPDIEEHVRLLRDVRSDDQRAGVVTRLQQSYGNAYVQKVVSRVNAGKRQPVGSVADSVRIVELDDGIRMSVQMRAVLDGEEAEEEPTSGGTEAEAAESAATPITETEEETLEFGAGTVEDAISPASVNVVQSTIQGGAALPGTAFGVCEPKIWKTNEVIEHSGFLGLGATTYEVKSSMNIEYHWMCRISTGRMLPMQAALR